MTSHSVGTFARKNPSIDAWLFDVRPLLIGFVILVRRERETATGRNREKCRQRGSPRSFRRAGDESEPGRALGSASLTSPQAVPRMRGHG